MILSDRSILERLKDGSLKIEPLSDPDLQVQPASIDLRLGDINYNDLEVFRYREENTILMPGAFTLGCTLERVSIPADLVAVVDGRSTYGRLGLAVHVTAGYINPGFEGQITLELVNHSAVPISLRRGDRVAQLRLHVMTTPSVRPYGHPSRGSKYQGQSNVTAARMELEKLIK